MCVCVPHESMYMYTGLQYDCGPQSVTTELLQLPPTTTTTTTAAVRASGASHTHTQTLHSTQLAYHSGGPAGGCARMLTLCTAQQRFPLFLSLSLRGGRVPLLPKRPAASQAISTLGVERVCACWDGGGALHCRQGGTAMRANSGATPLKYAALSAARAAQHGRDTIIAGLHCAGGEGEMGEGEGRGGGRVATGARPLPALRIKMVGRSRQSGHYNSYRACQGTTQIQSKGPSRWPL